MEQLYDMIVKRILKYVLAFRDIYFNEELSIKIKYQLEENGQGKNQISVLL